ncbi:MAG: pectin acetylesterase-family hydrolase [Actinomycetota bacterium]
MSNLNQTRKRTWRLSPIIAAAVMLVACGGGSSTESDSVVETTTSSMESSSTENPDSGTQSETMTFADQWKRIEAPADCMCANGAPWAYFVREANPTKVVFFLDGGGACFSAETCAPGAGQFKEAIGYDNGFSEANGVFDLDNPENPLADYSMVFVPYCTGDVHAGNTTKDYGNGIVVAHKGFVNGSTALNALAEMFPDVEDLVVAGVSAGSFPSAIYAGLAAELLPDAGIKVIADGSGAIPDAMGLVSSNWDVLGAVPDWPEFEGATYDMVTPSWTFEIAASRNPSIAFARHDYAFDSVLAGYAALAGVAADDLVTVMRTNEQRVEATGATVATWIAPGSDHTILQKPNLYTQTLDETRFIDWLRAFLTGESPQDVICTSCAG